jgi:CheY-like chemotaxis protein
MTTPALRRVLCVEDDPDIRSILEFSLTDVGGLQVLCCDSGTAALAAVAGFQPDLVLLDVMMPGMSGPDTLRALRPLPVMHGVPVVFLTAKALPHELEPLLALGATGVIVKPFDPMTLPQDMLPYWEHGRGAGVPPAVPP